MHARMTNRRGFTLIELLIVIVIIAILAGLTTAVVLRVGGVGTEAEATNEIRQLELAVENFKLKYGVYPPSSFAVPPTGASLVYAQRIWPRVSDFSTLAWPVTGTLQADQCLVYFLQGPAKNGWSANPADPTSTSGTRVGPFFEFKEVRLYKRTGDFYSYADPFATPGKKMPYLYFSSYNKQDGYLATDVTLGVSPYFITGTTRYYNRNTFQIISAGANFSFNGGGAWAPGGPGWNELAAGFDDLSNFHPGKLGVP